MKAILTVIGLDRIGIVAAISNELARLNINILDLSQTIMEKHFTMVMVCDISGITEDFQAVKQALQAVGEKIGMKVSIQRADIFDAMHKL